MHAELIYAALVNKGCKHRKIPQDTHAKNSFLTSSKRLLSLTVLPGGRLSFLGSGLEGAGVVMCFLEVLSWFAIRHKRQRINKFKTTCGFKEEKYIMKLFRL